MYKTIDQLDIKQKRVFIRTDFNVRIQEGKVADDTRIRATLPTLEYAIDKKAKIIIGCHLGRPKSPADTQYSLLPVAEHLSHLLNKDVLFPENCVGDIVKKLLSEMRDGDVMLLENLRFNEGEKKNDPQFAEKLASMAEVYVNDAFGASHRAHASTCGMVANFKEKGMGFLMKKEIEVLSNLLAKPEKPFLAVLGGAKVGDKIGVIENLMNYVNGFLIGGGMAYTFLKAKGVRVGNSLVEESKVHFAEKLMSRAASKGVEIVLPVDSVVAEKIEKGIPSKIVVNKDDWGNGMGLDIGPQTVALFGELIAKAKTIFWNGPLGVFEMPPFNKGTLEIARLIAENKVVSVIGGGDSLSAIKDSGIDPSKFTHLSTGGGASMEFLEGKTLPGLKVLEV